MTYEDMRVFVGFGGLFIFFAAFVLVLLYTFLPSNKKTFDEASQMALKEDQDDNSLRGNYGR